MHRSLAWSLAVVSCLACTQPDDEGGESSAMTEANPSGDGDGDNDGDGDGTTDDGTTSGDGDGDGETTTGDGDGDGDMTGDGDGDMTGDGDGDTTTGDGDGDGDTTGDGDGDTTGDGDGDTTSDGDGDTTGDGDGDDLQPLCEPVDALEVNDAIEHAIVLEDQDPDPNEYYHQTQALHICPGDSDWFYVPMWDPFPLQAPYHIGISVSTNPFNGLRLDVIHAGNMQYLIEGDQYSSLDAELSDLPFPGLYLHVYGATPETNQSYNWLIVSIAQVLFEDEVEGPWVGPLAD